MRVLNRFPRFTECLFPRSAWSSRRVMRPDTRSFARGLGFAGLLADGFLRLRLGGCRGFCVWKETNCVVGIPVDSGGFAESG